MGQEIKSVSFTEADEALFAKRLREETKILKRWFDEDAFDDSDLKCGVELEAWLLNEDFIPAPLSDKFIDNLAEPLVVPEISKFNFELNSEPYEIKGGVFSRIEADLFSLWEKCEKSAKDMGLKAMMIGTLPTLRDHMLTMGQLSPQKRYYALNERIMELRNGKPITIELEGKDHISLSHDNVITECAATSLQIHFGVSQANAGKYYNASIVASSLMAAVGANSPYFYGLELWDESRVSVFEQSVNLKSYKKLDGECATRVSLGNGYVKRSVLELFLENLDGYPVLLPDHVESDPENLEHLRLQNGTIWRWNRPLIGLDKKNKPSLRLEFRVPSAGPTIKDALANMAFQIAMVELIFEIEDLETKIPFNVAKDNFYQACKFGFDADITWVDGKSYNIQKLLLDQLLPHAEAALVKLGVSEQDANSYLGKIIHPRVLNGQNGAGWQKAFVRTHGARFQEMMEAYFTYQKQNIPVHEWRV